MAQCGYSSLIEPDNPCGPHWKYPKDVECIALKDYKKDVTSHLRFWNPFDAAINSEQKLLLYRAGKCWYISQAFILNLN